VLTIDSEEGEKDYVFDTQRKLFKFIKDMMDAEKA
jgi:hypothetical protein